MRPFFPTAVSLILLAIAPASWVAIATVGAQRSQAALTLSQSSVTIKVGEKANVTATVTLPGGQTSQVCFSVEGFPSSGFVTTFDPECVRPQNSLASTILTVEATPAAAPQSFTSYVNARIDATTLQASLDLIVVPAMPAWIPWSLILAFAAFFVITLAWPKRKRNRKKQKQ